MVLHRPVELARLIRTWSRIYGIPSSRAAPETRSSQRAIKHEEIAMGFLEVLESSAGIA
jgi:hypothetical protein